LQALLRAGGDQEARLGLPLARAATPGTSPGFVTMITELVAERLVNERPGAKRLSAAPAAVLGRLGPLPDICPAGCCAASAPGVGRSASAGPPASAATRAARAGGPR